MIQFLGNLSEQQSGDDSFYHFANLLDLCQPSFDLGIKTPTKILKNGKKLIKTSILCNECGKSGSKPIWMEEKVYGDVFSLWKERVEVMESCISSSSVKISGTKYPLHFDITSLLQDFGYIDSDDYFRSEEKMLNFFEQQKGPPEETLMSYIFLGYCSDFNFDHLLEGLLKSKKSLKDLSTDALEILNKLIKDPRVVNLIFYEIMFELEKGTQKLPCFSIYEQQKQIFEKYPILLVRLSLSFLAIWSLDLFDPIVRLWGFVVFSLLFIFGICDKYFYQMFQDKKTLETNPCLFKFCYMLGRSNAYQNTLPIYMVNCFTKDIKHVEFILDVQDNYNLMGTRSFIPPQIYINSNFDHHEFKFRYLSGYLFALFASSNKSGVSGGVVSEYTEVIDPFCMQFYILDFGVNFIKGIANVHEFELVLTYTIKEFFHLDWNGVAIIQLISYHKKNAIFSCITSMKKKYKIKYTNHRICSRFKNLTLKFEKAFETNSELLLISTQTNPTALLQSFRPKGFPEECKKDMDRIQKRNFSSQQEVDSITEKLTPRFTKKGDVKKSFFIPKGLFQDSKIHIPFSCENEKILEVVQENPVKMAMNLAPSLYLYEARSSGLEIPMEKRLISIAGNVAGGKVKRALRKERHDNTFSLLKEISPKSISIKTSLRLMSVVSEDSERLTKLRETNIKKLSLLPLKGLKKREMLHREKCQKMNSPKRIENLTQREKNFIAYRNFIPILILLRLSIHDIPNIWNYIKLTGRFPRGRYRHLKTNLIELSHTVKRERNFV
jgi:hypothetical protein